MPALLLALAIWPTTVMGPVQTLFVKVGPNPKIPGRSPGQTRAVVLLHGLGMQLLSKDKVIQARLRGWQEPRGLMVKHLSKESDVYSLSYGQNVPVEDIVPLSLITEHIKALSREGYSEIVLVGHSAGGLIARQLVEDHPDLGITKVIQVCAPNCGSPFAAVQLVRAVQVPFLDSMTRTRRTRCLKSREGKRIPDKVEFACIVGRCRIGNDYIVQCGSQWPEDLQKQGIPAYPLRITHWDVMITKRSAELIAKLVREPQRRWSQTQVKGACKNLFH